MAWNRRDGVRSEEGCQEEGKGDGGNWIWGEGLTEGNYDVRRVGERGWEAGLNGQLSGNRGGGRIGCGGGEERGVIAAKEKWAVTGRAAGGGRGISENGGERKIRGIGREPGIFGRRGKGRWRSRGIRGGG